MSFLTPLAFWAAAIVVPALLVLYFLKLRRREERIPSTLLWKRAIQDLQVNAPFQRLRKNLLLLLQLLVLLVAVLALARPIVKTELASESSVILLLDRSASMKTREGDRTRFDLAKEQAVRHVKALNRAGSSWTELFGGAPAQTRVMVIAFADRARVVSPFSTNTADLVRLIEELEPSDATTNLAEALELAEAYMMQTRIEQTVESAEQPSTMLLISDGAMGPLRDATVRYGTLKLLSVGETSDNVGVTALRLQRGYELPEQLSVFTQVANFGDREVQTDVALYVDGRLEKVKPLTLAPPARGEPPETQPAGAGEVGNAPDRRRGASSASLTFDFTLDRAALLEVRISRPDALTVDDRAFVQAPAPRRLKALLVSAGNYFLEKMVQFLPLEEFKYLTPGQYEAAPDSEIAADGRSLYDVVIFDQHSTARLPAGAYLFIASTPQIPEIKAAGETGEQAMLWWDETHPMLRYVALDYVYASSGVRLELPKEARKLVEGSAGPVLAVYAKDGRQYALLNFPIEDSTFWHNQSFPKFMYNTVSFLGALGDASGRQTLRPGEALRIQLSAGAREATVTTPAGKKMTAHADASGGATFAGTDEVGVYTVSPASEDRARFAVNLEDARESDIAPGQTIRVGDTAVAAGQRIETATPEVWRWAIGAALLIVLVEWYIYNRRVMI